MSERDQWRQDLDQARKARALQADSCCPINPRLEEIIRELETNLGIRKAEKSIKGGNNSIRNDEIWPEEESDYALRRRLATSGKY